MKKGFTLIELLVVVLMVGILSAIALPQYRRSVERTRVAEVQTLLRAIYESQERKLWELGNGIKFYSQVYNKAGDFGFEKLDITVKGTYEPNARGISRFLNTENFRYEMRPSASANLIFATAIKGDYKGAQIRYDGRQFVCNESTAIGAKACKIWAASTWNQL